LGSHGFGAVDGAVNNKFGAKLVIMIIARAASPYWRGAKPRPLWRRAYDVKATSL